MDAYIETEPAPRAFTVLSELGGCRRTGARPESAGSLAAGTAARTTGRNLA